jgi:molecular chaperone GrpE
MSEPKPSEGDKPETVETNGPGPEAANEGTSGGAPGPAAGASEPLKAQAYVDPEIAAEAQLAAWEAERSDLTDRLMRAHAEMDNLRKRTEREKADTTKYAITRFAGDMLAVVDNLERALAALPKSEAMEPQTKALFEGVELTAQDLRKALERHSVVRIDALGAIFDPNFHQAVMEEENKEVATGTVVRVLQEGYRIGDRVLRPSMVAVARGGAKPVKAAAGAGGWPEQSGEAGSSRAKSASDDTTGDTGNDTGQTG